MGMKAARDFDLLNSPLKGTNLIEASAGTGKTYTVEGLFLRLLLEKQFLVNEILVVTFTEAATSELKVRIRLKLMAALEALSVGGSDDPFLDELIRKIMPEKTSLRAPVFTGMLEQGLRDFDQSAIFTIHGFCRRVLRENAFESGFLFDTELVTNQNEFVKEIVEDYWRIQLHGVSPLFARYALGNGFMPGKLMEYAIQTSSRPYLKVIPDIKESDCFDAQEAERTFREAFDNVRRSWEDQREKVREILANWKGLNRNKYRKTSLARWIGYLDRFLKTGGPDIFLPDKFEKFTSGNLTSSMNGDNPAPTHPFFDLCETLQQRYNVLVSVFEHRLLVLKRNLFDYVKKELAHRKERRNVQSFDDLLLKLQGALERKGSVNRLARIIRTKFRAALVDEFQDTDPVQYAIFKRLFNYPAGILFFVGDPKQAVYSFRGADVFTYLSAARAVDAHYTLRENWRAQPVLIEAVNTIFNGVERPFVYPEIAFHKAVPAGKKQVEILLQEGDPADSFELWFADPLKTTGREKDIPKGKARSLIARAVAAEVARLAEDGIKKNVLLGTRGLTAGDIAVLVRKNSEAFLIQKALTSYSVPAVVYSTANIFDSYEAEEIYRVLAAICEPGREPLVRAALITDMIGLGGEEIEDLAIRNIKWEAWLTRFSEYNAFWKSHGFIRMFRDFLNKEDVLPRLMAFVDGERRCTDLLHLTEIIQRVSDSENFGMRELVKWLSIQQDPNAIRLEEHQLRLESDEKAVRIVTMHRSKGLEYPVVFCPFTWEKSELNHNGRPFIFHDRHAKMRATLELGSEQKDLNLRSAEEEALAENVRLLYVALTRAKSRCYLVWGRFNQGGSSAPAYVFHHPKDIKKDDNIARGMAKRFKAMSNEQILKDLKKLQKFSHDSIRVRDIPKVDESRGIVDRQEKRPALVCRDFTGKIEADWRVTSFSALTFGAISEGYDYDALNLTIEKDGNEMAPETGAGEEMPLTGIFTFPRGTKPGTFLHAVLEHLDFTEQSSGVVRELVTDKLVQYGFDYSWADTICELLKKVTNAPLFKGHGGLRLFDIRNEDRLNELEFYFPLKTTSSESLKNVMTSYYGNNFRSDIPQGIEGLRFAPTEGFMRGFIDLVFRWQDRYYLIDWKSNFLGASIEAYNRPSLSAAMQRHFYILQYLLYTLALDQYLRLRIPDYQYETHFGGVCYMFLRGIDPDKGSDFGLYEDRPPAELIGLLKKELIA